MLENVRHYLISLIIYRKQPPILNSRLDWTAIGEACGIEDEMTTELRKQLRPALDAIIRWLILGSGDFVLVPQIHAFTMSSVQPPPPGMLPRRLETDPGVFRLGDPDASAEVTAMVGHCSFLANDKQLLSSPLPDIIHARGERRLMDLVGMIHAEMVGGLAARDMILSRLLEVLFIDALRSTGGAETSPGLLRGLSDIRLAPVLRRIHQDASGGVSVEELAETAAMSRSAFFDRFRRQVGVPPMEYVTGWRMALAKDLLVRQEAPLIEIATRIGYASSSAFSVAFTRHVGVTPGVFVRTN